VKSPPNCRGFLIEQEFLRSKSSSLVSPNSIINTMPKGVSPEAPGRNYFKVMIVVHCTLCERYLILPILHHKPRYRRSHSLDDAGPPVVLVASLLDCSPLATISVAFDRAW